MEVGGQQLSFQAHGVNNPDARTNTCCRWPPLRKALRNGHCLPSILPAVKRLYISNEGKETVTHDALRKYHWKLNIHFSTWTVDQSFALKASI